MLVKILSHPGHDISKCYMEATGPAIGPWGAWMAPGFLSLSKVVLDQYVCVQFALSRSIHRFSQSKYGTQHIQNQCSL